MVEVSNISLVVAFAAGVLSFLSPCCLPLVPGYLAVVAGDDRGRRTTARRTASFLAGFSVLFVALGITATALGGFLQLNRPVLSLFGGTIVVVMGLLMLRPQGLTFPFLSRFAAGPATRLKQGGPALTGMAFAVAWTPCIGPTLGAILTLSAASATTSTAAVLLSLYTFGLMLPFAATALGFQGVSRRLRQARRMARGVRIAGALVLIGMGLLMAADRLTVLNIALQRMSVGVGYDIWQSL